MAEAIMGITKAQALGEKLIDTFVALDYHTRVMKAPLETVKGCDGEKGVISIEMLGRALTESADHTATVIPVRMGFGPRYDTEGQIKGVTGTGQLVASTSSAEFWPLFEVDKEQIIDKWHVKTATLTGNVAAVGNHWLEVIDDEHDYLPILGAAFDNACSVHFRDEHDWSNGTPDPQIISSNLIDANGERIGIAAKIIARRNGAREIDGAVVYGFPMLAKDRDTAKTTKASMFWVHFWIYRRRLLKPCIINWQWGVHCMWMKKRFALKLIDDRVAEMQLKAFYRALMEWIMNMRRDQASHAALDAVNRAIAAGAGGDAPEFNPDLIILWHFLNQKNGEWELFDRQTMYDIEYAHNDELLKLKISPENEDLKINASTKGEFLVVIHNRLMIDINTGVNYEIRRSMPKIVYQVLEVGAVGPGDKARN